MAAKTKPKPKLTPEQKRQRWLRQPVMPGSGLTRGQLRRESKAAVTTKYGPLTQQQRTGVQEAKTYQRDIGTYFDDYLRHVQQSADRVREAGQRASTTLQNLQGGVTGLAAADLTGIQQPANQDAAARGAQAGDLTGMASNAAAIRQAQLGTLGAQQARINQGAEDYATHKADVVAPSQRLQGLAMAQGRVRQAREALGQTARERGAYKQQYRQERLGEEAKSILAQQALGLDVAKTRASLRASSPAGQQASTFAREMAENAAKYGYTPKDWKALGNAGRRDVINADKTKPADTVYSEGAFAGRTKSEVQSMSPAKRRKLVNAYQNKGSGPGGGPDMLTPGQAGAGLRELAGLKNWAAKARAGQPFIAGHAAQPAMGRYEAQRKIEQNVDQPKHPMLLRAALDAVYDRHLSAYTERGLRTAGYRPIEVARSLSVPTHKRFMREGGARAYGGPH